MLAKVVRAWAFLSAVIIVGVVVFLFAYVLVKGAGVISWGFLTTSPNGAVLGSEGGIAPAIIGSLWFVLTALVMGAIPAIGTAVCMVYYCKTARLAKLVHGVMRTFAGVPSIVLGLFSYSLFVVGFGLNRSVFVASTALALMIIPFIEVRVEHALRSIPRELVMSSYSLGCSRLYTIVHVVLPWCVGEIVAALVLGSCYAMGATAPLMFTGGVAFAPAPSSLFDPAMALPLHLYLLIAQGNTMPQVYGTAFVLMIVVLASNMLVAWFARRRKRSWTKS